MVDSFVCQGWRTVILKAYFFIWTLGNRTRIKCDLADYSGFIILRIGFLRHPFKNYTLSI